MERTLALVGVTEFEARRLRMFYTRLCRTYSRCKELEDKGDFQTLRILRCEVLYTGFSERGYKSGALKDMGTVYFHKVWGGVAGLQGEIRGYVKDDRERMWFMINQIGRLLGRRMVPVRSRAIPPVYKLLEGVRDGNELALFADRWYLNRLWGLEGDGLEWMRKNMEKEKIEDGELMVRGIRRVEEESRVN